MQGFAAAASACTGGGVDGKTLLSLSEADFIAEMGLTKLQVDICAHTLTHAHTHTRPHALTQPRVEARRTLSPVALNQPRGGLAKPALP